MVLLPLLYPEHLSAPLHLEVLLLQMDLKILWLQKVLLIPEDQMDQLRQLDLKILLDPKAQMLLLDLFLLPAPLLPYLLQKDL